MRKRSLLPFTVLLSALTPLALGGARPAMAQAVSDISSQPARQTPATGQTPGLGTDVPLPPLPPDVALAQKVTLAQAVAYGLEHSPQITAARYGIAGARANYVGQRVPANPTIGFSGLNNTVAPTYLGDLSNYAVYVPVETSGRLRWRTAQSKNEWLQSQSDAQTTSLNVRQSVTNAYVALQIANRALTDEREAYANAVQLRDLTLKQFMAGGAPQTSAIRTQVALTQEAANLFSAINAVRDARATLNVQMGRDVSEPVDAAEPLTYSPIHPNLDALQAQAAKNRPELVSAEYARRALSAAGNLARANLYPDLILGSALNQPSGGVDLGLTFPLFDLGSIRGAVQQAQKQEKAQEATQKQLRQSVQLDVQTAYDALSLAERSVEAYQSGILPQSESLLQRTEKGFTLGASTVLDLIDAQATLRTVRIAYYGAIGQYRQALAQLERAVGVPISALDIALAQPFASPTSPATNSAPEAEPKRSNPSLNP